MFGRFSEGIKAGFLGQRGNSVPRATVSPGRLLRPERERSYLLACPGQASISKLPLVVALHGAGASARQLFGLAFPPSPFSVWLEIAEREKLLVVAVDAAKGGWSDCFASAERVAMEPAAGIEETAHFWRDLAQLPAAPVQAEVAHRHAWDKTRVSHYVWGDAPDQLQVGLYRIANGGHAEPSGTQRYPVWINRLVGPQNADIEVAEAAWKFFKDKRNRHRSATKGRPGEILTGGCNSC